MMDAAWEQAVRCADVPTVRTLLAQAGADLSLRGSGASGFADKTAYDLALEREMQALSKMQVPKPEQPGA